MQDTTLQIMAMDVSLGEDHMQLVFTTALALPVGMTPQGPQYMPIQDGVYRVPMRKQTAIDYANKILEEADKLPDDEEPRPQSDILVANSMSDVENVARQAEQFRSHHGR